MKPKITNSEIDAIQVNIITETSVITRFWIAYGAALCAAFLGYLLHLGVISAAMGLAAVLVLAIAHWRIRDAFGQTPVLATLDNYDATPSPAIRVIENDPECKAWGIDVTKEDWPRLFKTGMRVQALARIETFEAKSLAIIGYGFVVTMLLSK